MTNIVRRLAGVGVALAPLATLADVAVAAPAISSAQCEGG